jgi:chromosome transmission fidelity protein 18
MSETNSSNDKNINSIFPDQNKESNNEISLLYTEKYKPKHYSDLLTEEKINREILTWVKSWDDVVFNRKFNIPKIPVPIMNNSLSPNKPKFNKTGLKKDEKNKDNLFQYIEVDYIRQKHKIILIGGQPGIGKTTLANIIAKQCGYEPIVVNASDERTTDKLILRIYNSTLIHNLTNLKKDQKRKPTLLILDEIDGISSNSKKPIKTIIDFIKTGHLDKKILEENKKEILDGIKNNDKVLGLGGKANFSRFNRNIKRNKNNFNNNKENDLTSDEDDISNNDEDDDENTNNEKTYVKRRNTNQGIQRPIICICNDLYAKQLSLLRKEALVYNLKKIDEKKLFDLLYSITKKENLPIDKTTIKNICELCNSDIRSCLLCLQFFSYHKKNSELISEVIHDKEKLKYICNKDFNENLFNVWNKIFYRIDNNSNYNEELSYKDIKNLYDSCGEHKKIYEGLFNNYLKISTRERDTLEDIQKRSELTEIFSYEDTIQGRGFSLMPGSVDNYINLSGAYINKYYYAKNFEKGLIEYTSLYFDYKSQLRNYNSIIENIQENIYEKKHILYKKDELVINILPYIYEMINPNFREISYELLNQKEKKSVDTAISLLLYFGIDMKENTGNQDYKQNYISFEPDIKKLITYNNNINANDEQENENGENNEFLLNYNKQLILKAEYEKHKNLSKFNEEKKDKNPNDKVKEEQDNYNRNFNLLLNNMGVGKKRKFNEIKKYESKFIYKFNEGLTDCVRRPLDISYFYCK